MTLRPDKQVRDAFFASGWKQTEFRKALRKYGVKLSSFGLSRRLNGHTPISVKECVAFARVLGVNPDWNGRAA